MARNSKHVWEVMQSDAMVLLKGAVVITLATGFFAIYMIGLRRIAHVFGASPNLFAPAAMLVIIAAAFMALWVRSVIDRARPTTKEDG